MWALSKSLALSADNLPQDYWMQVKLGIEIGNITNVKGRIVGSSLFGVKPMTRCAFGSNQ